MENHLQPFIQSLRKWKREISFITNQLWMVMGILGLSGERFNYSVLIPTRKKDRFNYLFFLFLESVFDPQKYLNDYTNYNWRFNQKIEIEI